MDESGKALRPERDLSARPSLDSARGGRTELEPPEGSEEDRISASREDQLWRQLGVRAPADPGDAASLAVEHKGAGHPVDAGLAAEVGSHLGVPLDGARVHTDPLSRAATRAMGARAFAHRQDIFLGPGESAQDRELIAHELAHVGQYLAGAADARPQRKLAVGAEGSPAEQHADEIAGKAQGGGLTPTHLIVDGGTLASGQMEKSTFLAQLRQAVVVAAEQELGKLGATAGCPFLDRYFSKYAALPAGASELLIRRWISSSKSATAASELIPPVVARAREAVRSWRATGRVPPDLAALDPDLGGVQASVPSVGGAAHAMSLEGMEAELGPGDALDGTTAARMSRALGTDVSAARLHSGPVAERKAAEAGALAFAIGENVVLGSRAPARGSLAGDALLAHELAHVAQQKHAAADPSARLRPIGDEDVAAEHDADRAAAGDLTAEQLSEQRVAQLSALAHRAGDVMRTGLQLQRCAEWKEDVSLQAKLGLSIELSPAPAEGKPLIVGQSVKVSLKQQIAGEHKAVVYHWEAIDARGNKYLYANGESTSVQMIWPGTTTIRAAVGAPGGDVIPTTTVEHKVEAIRADTRAQQLVDSAEAPAEWKTFRASQDVNLALLSPDNTPSKDQAVFVRGGGANPAPHGEGQVGFSLGYKEGEAAPPGRTHHWYAVPLQSKDAPATLGTAPKTTLGGKDAYDLGTSTTAQLSTKHKGVFVVTCQLFDSGQKAAEASFVQTVLEPKEIEAVKDLKTQLGQVDGEMQEMATNAKGDPDVVPVTAFHVDAHNGGETQLSMFIGKRKDGSLMMINATPGLKLTENRVRFAGATTAAVLDDFDSNNKYPTGIVRFHVPGGKVAGVAAADRSIQTTGDTTLGHIAGALGMAALVVSLAAIPFTGGASATATVLLLGGAGLGVAAGAFSLADHLSNADFTSTSVALDCLQIAASMVDLGFAVKALRSSPALLVANRAARYAMWGNLAIQGASAVLISVEAIDQIAKIMDDPALSRSEKLSALTRLIATLVVTGALLLLSYKSMGEAKARMAAHFGETGKSLKDLDAAALGLIDDQVLATLKAAGKEDLERLAAMVRQDPALVTRLPGRKNVFGALKGCKTNEANELEMRLLSQRLSEAGLKGNNVKRVTDAFQAAGIDAATAHLLTDADLARLKSADDALAGARSKRDADPAKAAALATAKSEMDAITGVAGSTKAEMRAALAHINGMADPAFVTDAVAALRAKFPKLPAEDLAALGRLDKEALIALESASESDVRKIAAHTRSGAQSDVEDILRSYYYKAKKPARKDGTPYDAPKGVGSRLEGSLENLAVARARGYPHGFADAAQYEAFLAKVKASLDKRKIPSGDVRVHGSAIHSKTPGDIDVAVIVDEATFGALTAQFKSAAKGDAAAVKALNADAAKGKISSSNFYPDTKPSAANEAAGAAGTLDTQISIIKAGSEFDVGPYLKK